MSNCILIVNPDVSTRALMYSMLQGQGHRLEEVETATAALRFLAKTPAHLVLIGVESDFTASIDLLVQIRRAHPACKVLFFTSTTKPEQQRESLMRGAEAYFRFPAPANQLRAVVAQALPDEPESNRVRREATTLVANTYNGAASFRSGVATIPSPGSEPQGHAPGMMANGSRVVDSVCDDATFRKLLDMAEALALKRSPFLITGEKGSGRTFLARTLHAQSPWREGPFLVVSCSPNEDHDEARQIVELFGRVHPDDPDADEPGLLAKANGGTLFLDDLQDLPPSLQNHLLRVVRDNEFQPVGSSRMERLGCRVILGSCEDLSDLVEEGQFRSDLFYALSTVTLKIPPLRHRGPDILKLAEHFRDRYARQEGKPVIGISAEAGRRLSGHDWPRNIAELKSVMQRAVSRCRGHWIEPNHIDLETRELPPTGSRPSSDDYNRQSILPLKEALEEPEKRLILEALRALNWNRQETARVLDINRTTLYKKMKKYGLVFEEPIWSN